MRRRPTGVQRSSGRSELRADLRGLSYPRSDASIKVFGTIHWRPSAEEMIAQLVKGQEAAVRTARAVFPSVERAGDEPTADLLTQRMQVHEKTAWMLRSLLE
jgi:DNA-binding ferritin-like protein